MTLLLPTPIVSTSWLAEHLAHPKVRVLDASWYLPAAGRDARAEYEAAHIPGAVLADIDALSDAQAPYPHTVPAPDVLAERFGALGVGDGHTVVVYDGSGQLFSAPRVWYMLRALGVQSVAVLDGGLPRWRAEGRLLGSGVSSAPTAVLTPRFDAARWRDLAAMRAVVATGSAQIVDARSLGRFSAAEPEPRAGVRGGHMPGARHVHYASLTDAEGRLLAKDVLRDRVTAAGLDPSRPIVASCGSGVTACAVVLALDAIGAREVAVYDGSWTEWGSQADTPVETGPPAS
jgi:thiosulfate/3-mercaptopyruvate sulfurtransferase